MLTISPQVGHSISVASRRESRPRFIAPPRLLDLTAPTAERMNLDAPIPSGAKPNPVLLIFFAGLLHRETFPAATLTNCQVQREEKELYFPLIAPGKNKSPGLERKKKFPSKPGLSEYLIYY